METGKVEVPNVCYEYDGSMVAVCKWIYNFDLISKPELVIVKGKSDTEKILALQKRIAELERIVGQKEIELIFKKKMIDIAEDKFGIEIKRKPSKKP